MAEVKKWRDLDEFLQEARHIHLKDYDTAKWLLDFAYRDLRRLNKTELAKVAMDVVVFYEVEKRRERPALGDRGDLTAPFKDKANLRDFLSSTAQFREAGLFSKKPDGLLTRFQAEVKQRFEDCRLNHAQWQFVNPPVRESFEVFPRKINGTLPKYYHRDFPGETWLTWLLSLATRVVARERERFMICDNPRCKKPFVAQRPQTAKYCSPTCASYVNVNKMRGNIPRD